MVFWGRQWEEETCWHGFEPSAFGARLLRLHPPSVNQNTGSKERVWMRLFNAEHEFQSKLYSLYNPETIAEFYAIPFEFCSCLSNLLLDKFSSPWSFSAIIICFFRVLAPPAWITVHARLSKSDDLCAIFRIHSNSWSYIDGLLRCFSRSQEDIVQFYVICTLRWCLQVPCLSGYHIMR